MAILSRPRLFSHPCPTSEFEQAEAVHAAREIERAEDDADASVLVFIGAASDDPDPTPPTAGRLRMAPRSVVEAVARQLDDDALILLIGEPHLSQFDPELVVECYSAEVVRRLEQQSSTFSGAISPARTHAFNRCRVTPSNSTSAAVV